MYYVKPFDPWKSKLCTCPPKFSFNPYTGCYHNCIYCYSTYIPRFHELRLKKDLFRKLVKDLEKIPKNSLISMSNSSDPYPPIERELKITRKCLEIMSDFDIKLLIVTKSDIVARDLDVFPKKSAVGITITSLKTAKVIEPNAPDPEKRIEALKIIKECGVPVILRLDPIIPFLTEDEAMKVLEKCDFVDHVVTSTLKLRKDILARFSKVLPDLAEVYKRIYTERVGSYMYLPKDFRIRLLKAIEEKCNELGVSCAFCREGILFKAKSCDGSHLIPS
ncbi:SPL family radical SAM protein [Archaeoglobus profundus]|uniref:Radical SAM domain protein n=1 Tax=Archaeoglobus profundus (strain DSM 5631 / JCM 9629 / NBRC 100127 / Av18) TaxID=572546 RepID=D2RGQ7_ARCPA|nr:Radical SAM domain protein [Archaeoglobus profundus DSM 5631]